MVRWYICVIFILFFFVMDTHLSASPFWAPPVKQAVSSSGTVASTINEVSLQLAVGEKQSQVIYK